MRRSLCIPVISALALVGLVHAFQGSEKSNFLHSFGDPYPRIVHQVFYHVQKKYVEPDRAQPRQLVEGALLGLEAQYPAVLVEVDAERKSVRVQVDEAEKTFDLAPAEQFSRAADVLNTMLAFIANSLEEVAEKKDIYYFALNGALDALDPHSNVFSPKHFKEFMIGTRGTFGGIGFVFGIRDGEMTIITPIEGTPGDRAGLRSGDRILYIDGEPTINMAVDVAANKMRGEPGTQVTLTLMREGWSEPKPTTFTREIIHVDSVESYVLNGNSEAPVIYAKVKNFQKDTTDELRKAIDEAEAAHADLKGVILDLRNNPGGLLEQAIALSDGFLDEGTIVATRGPEADSNDRSEARADDPQISDRPVVVLLNQGSASASEIVSGALKSSRALLIGQKTFGKGSVQKLYPLTDGGALKLTVAQYLTPGDISIQSIGIQPDIAVYPAGVSAGKMRLGPPPSHVEEADLDNAFTEWGNSHDKPWAEIQFLKPEEVEEDKRSFAELSREEKAGRLAEDFEIRLARRILARVDSAGDDRSREALREASEAVLVEMRQEQTEALRSVLAEQDVNWVPGATAEGVKLEVSVPGETVLAGGAKTRLRFSVKNVGSVAAHQVWGRTDSSNPLLKNLDFAFGKVDPGEERSWETEVEVPKSVLQRWDEVTLKVNAGEAENVASGTGAARVVGLAKPEFGYRYDLSDENLADPDRSGDGILEEGERARLLLSVRNVGAGASAAVEANIRGDEKEELYLEEARRKLEDLGPGQQQDAPMSFRVVKATEENKVSVGVTLSDQEFSTFFADSLTFETGKPYAAKMARFPPTFELKPPPLHTPADRVVLEIRVRDDEGVKDFFAYLGEKKIRYERNRSSAADLVVRLEVELAEGSNRLVLAARDQKDIRGSQTFFIYRSPSGKGGEKLGMN